jgi:predicted nucleic acid-binding protein
MKVLIDTNVILDVLTKRDPHYASSASFLKLCGKKVVGCISTSQTTDVFYLLQRFGLDAAEAKEAIQKLTDHLKLLDLISSDVENVLRSEVSDYEDALLTFQAQRQKVDFIVTRNEKDFKQSRVSAISPKEFIELFSGTQFHSEENT